jgi:very-short-patch-repair endonuclease
MMQRRKPLTRRKGLKVRAAASTGAGKCDQALWAALQEHRIARFGFRRHERLGPYVVDMICPNARLVILIDDGALSSRVAWLKAAGYRVMIFSRADASTPQRVLDSIADAFDLRPVK